MPYKMPVKEFVDKYGFNKASEISAEIDNHNEDFECNGFACHTCMFSSDNNGTEDSCCSRIRRIRNIELKKFLNKEYKPKSFVDYLEL